MCGVDKSPFLAQNDPKFHFLKNNSLEMTVICI